jgi:hypothetical protein
MQCLGSSSCNTFRLAENRSKITFLKNNTSQFRDFLTVKKNQIIYKNTFSNKINHFSVLILLYTVSKSLENRNEWFSRKTQKQVN